MKTRILALMSLVILVGCATPGSSQETGERIVVQVATIALIDRASNPADKAARVVEAINSTQTLLLDSKATVGTLRAALTQRVAERNLSPGEQLIALEAINTIADEVEKRVGAGLLSPEAVVSINKVCDWVKNTAALYVSHPA